MREANFTRTGCYDNLPLVVVATIGCAAIIDDGPACQAAPAFLPMVTGNATDGLGLSIAQRIANQHGGLIQVQSEPGNTCFTLLLPMEI